MTEQHIGADTTADQITQTTDGNTASSGRRRFVRQLAAGGAGAAIGAIALSERAAAGDSGGAAVGGNALELGSSPTNTAADQTYVEYSGTDPIADSSMLSVGQERPSSTDGNDVYPAAVGGYGKEKVPTGVHGSTLNPEGYGAVVASLAPAVDESADPVPNAPTGLAVASLAGPQIKFIELPGAVSGPTPGTHSPGELYVDADGTLWFTVPTPPETTGGEPGVRFVKLAGASTTGAFNPLPEPVRIIDTRDGPTKPAASSTTIVDITKDEFGADSGVPAASTAVQLNVTVAQTEVKGYFSIGAADITIPDDATFASGNWFTELQIVNANVTSAVDTAGAIQVKLGPEGGAHIIVDCVGFYL